MTKRIKRKKQALVIGLSLSAAVLLIGILSNPVIGQETDGAPANLDVILLIDNSSSMSRVIPGDPRTPTDPDALRIRAAKFLIDYLRANAETLEANYRAGVVSFGGSVGDFQPLRLLKDDEVRDSIRAEIINYTDFRPPLETALREFRAKSFGSGNQTAVVLFTDGRPQPADEAMTEQQLQQYFQDPSLTDIVAALDEEGVALFVVAVGSAQSDQTHWVQLIPEEQYIAIDDTTDLTDVFHTIVADLTGVTALAPRTLPASQETFVEVEPYLEHITFSFMKSDPSTVITLTGPDGPHDPRTGGTTNVYHEIYSESNPSPGLWTISWQGEGMVQLWVDKRFPVLQIEPMGTPHALGKPFEVQASLLQKGKSVLDPALALEADVTTPTGEKVVLPLTDHENGTYANTYEDVNTEGIYTVMARAILDGEVLETRSNIVSISVFATPAIAQFEPLGEEHTISQTVTLQATIRHYERLPDDIEKIKVSMTGPTADTILLYDDGRTPDERAGDGVFTGKSVVIEIPGQYYFDISTNGWTGEGLPFNLTGHTEAAFVSSSAIPSLEQFRVVGEPPLSQPVTLEAVVRNFDRLPDDTVLEVTMSGPMTGTISLHDDGQPPDRHADDGVFTGKSPLIKESGQYTFDLLYNDRTEEGLPFGLAGRTEATLESLFSSRMAIERLQKYLSRWDGWFTLGTVMLIGGMGVAAVGGLWWLRRRATWVKRLEEVDEDRTQLRTQIDKLRDLERLLQDAKIAAHEAKEDPEKREEADEKIQAVLDCAEEYLESAEEKATDAAHEAWFERLSMWQSDPERQRQKIYEGARTSKEASLEGLGDALRERWTQQPEIALDEIYGLVEHGAQPLLFVHLAPGDADGEEIEIADAPRMICGHISRTMVADETNTTTLLSRAAKAFHQASLVDIRGCTEMEQVYDFFSSLDYPCKPVNWQDIARLDLVPHSVQQAITLAREGFEFQAPVQEMEPRLEELKASIQQSLPANSPERALLLALADKWLSEIRKIRREPFDYRARLAIELSPSLSTDVLEEEREKEETWELIQLPVILRGLGPGDAFRVHLEIVGGEGCKIEQTSQELDILSKGQVGVRFFTIRHAQSSCFSIEGQYLDVNGLQELPILRRGGVELAPVEVREERYIDRNPYITDRPLQGQEDWLLVQERDRQLQELLGWVQGNAGRRIAVRGLRRTGKTTLLFRFCDQAFERDFLPVYIDALVWEAEWEEAKRRPREEWWTSKTLLTKMASAIHLEAALKAGVECKPSDRVGELGEFQHFVERVQERTRRRLVVVFDEADSLARFERFDTLDRTCFSPLVRSGLYLVFAHELASPYWNSKEIDGVRTPLLSRESTMNLACEPAHLDYSQLAQEYLWRITGGYPALVQLICHRLVKTLNRQPFGLNQVVRVSHLKGITKDILTSKDDRLLISYLRHGFDLDERRFLITLARNNWIDPQTGIVTKLCIARGDVVEADTELQSRFSEEWEWDADSLSRFGVDSTEEWLNDMFYRLRSKQIIDFYDEDDQRLGILRLRVGLLYLLLRGENPVDKQQGS